ncbi:MAG: motB2 [Paucimonas sp.]|nr:motB2 [Paucimonas sp.]
MADEGLRPIIVKRIKKGGGGHHGGAWKIAYADFVTAMMAFFLLMWLLGSTAKGDLAGIADYFKTPLKVAMGGGSGSGDSSSVINGGGKDLTRKDGQVRRADDIPSKKTYSLKAAQADIEKLELGRLKALKQKIIPNMISLSGHTDATPYSTGEKSYSNWELSSDRANASRRELVAGGMDESKVLRVVGLSSAIMLDKNDPFNPINRRISIIVLNKKAEESLTRNGGSLDVKDGEEAKKGIVEVTAK